MVDHHAGSDRGASSLDRKITGRAAAVLLCLVAMSVSAALGQSEPVLPDDPVEERAKIRVRTVRIRIEPGRLSTPGECLQLGVEDLKVSLRGKRIKDPSALRLEREPQRAVHALLIDTSGSMLGRLGHARHAASEYVKRLRPDLDRAMIVTFDDSVVLVEGLTSDRDRLVESMKGTQIAGSTSMLDALYYSMLELRAQRERPVIVVLTDGVDTSSVFERQDVLDLVERTPEVSVFSIGLGLPYAQRIAARGSAWWMSPPGGSRGVNSTKRFLQRLATRTNGRFFEVDAGSKLERVFLRVREMLENEGTLSVVDPEPDAADPGRLKVSSRNSDCNVLVFQAWGTTENDPTRLPIIETSGELPRRFVLPGRRLLPVDSTHSTTILADPTCRTVFRDTPVGSHPGGSPDGFVEVDKYGMHGCGEDVTLQYGVLYKPKQEWKVHFNHWVGLKTRPFEMPVPMVTGLPTDPVTLMDSLAEMALAAADDPIETDPRLVPADAHARPYHDLPCFADGASFLEVRSRLARALYARPDYRYWVLDRLRRDSEVAMADLEEVYRRRFPDTPEEVLKEVVRETDEGREILDLARAPAEIDLQRYLGAWLGDVSAHDLFVGWEVELVNRALAFTEPSDFEAALEPWESLRNVLFVPSYNRVLALLTPGYDPERDRIGYWRVVLPRPSWLGARVHGLPGEGDLAEVPLDLIPNRPFALWLVGYLKRSRPDLVEGWREKGYRIRSIEYELTGEAGEHNAAQAFREHRITVIFEDDAGTGRGELVADLALSKKKRKPRIERLQWIPIEGPSRERVRLAISLPGSFFPLPDRVAQGVGKGPEAIALRLTRALCKLADVALFLGLGRAVVQHRDPDPLAIGVEAQDLDGHLGAGRDGGLPPIPLARLRKGRDVRQCLDPRFQLDECAELGDPGDVPFQYLADLVGVQRRRPRVGLKLLQPERDLALFVVDAEDLDGDLVARLNHRVGVRHPRPAHLRDVEQALYAPAEVDEGSVRHHRRDAAGQDGAGKDGAPDFFGPLALFFLEQGAPGDDQVFTTLFELDDSKDVDLSLVNRRIGGEAVVDLRDRAEGTLSRELNLVPALDHLLDTSFHREPGPEGVFESLSGGSPPGELVRESQPAGGRDDDGLDDVTDLHVDLTVRVHELFHVDACLALPTDIDEGDALPERHDGPLDRLALLEGPRLGRFLQHPGKVFLLVGGTLRGRFFGSGWSRVVLWRVGVVVKCHARPPSGASSILLLGRRAVSWHGRI